MCKDYSTSGVYWEFFHGSYFTSQTVEEGTVLSNPRALRGFDVSKAFGQV